MIMHEPMNESEASIVQAGVLTGTVDALDLQCIAQDYEAWVAESDSYTASLIRTDREGAE